jgi:hypothetical protein
MSRTWRIIGAVQGVYYVVTGIWPLVHLRSFEAVTGPKTDHWLVQTVGVLAAAIGVSLLAGVLRRAASLEWWVLSFSAAIAFAGVDFVFALSGVISRIYLVDGAAQLVFILILGVTLVRHRRSAC